MNITNDAVTIMQGDAYDVAFELLDEDGAVLSPVDIDLLEFMIGELRFTYPEEIVSDEADGAFVLRLTQERTFALPAGYLPVQMRIKALNGGVYGQWQLPSVRVIPSRSKVVL